MSFTAKYLPVQRQKYFTFFASGGSAAVAPDVEFTEAFAPSFAFEIDMIRLHMSAVHISVVDYTLNLSHHLDSAYNQLLISQAMLGVDDVLYQPGRTLILHSGDVLNMSLIISAVNVFGLEIAGWAVTQPAGGWS